MAAICMHALLVNLFNHKQVEGKLIKTYDIEYHSPHLQGEEIPALCKGCPEGFPCPFESAVIPGNSVCHLSGYSGYIYIFEECREVCYNLLA